ncbi:MAG: hypothetical protein Tsb002_36510 [Wenzhouxiangellaceae bacterium]
MLWVFLLNFLLLLALIIVDDFQLNNPEYYLLSFIGLLPLLNGLLDCVSLGFSRYFLNAVANKKQSEWKSAGFILLDVILAVVLMVGIVVVIIGYLALMENRIRFGGFEPVMVVTDLLQGLKDRPWSPEHYWVYFMFVSTLIPTLIHFMVGSSAIVQYISSHTIVNRWRQRAIQYLEHDDQHKTKAALYLTIVPVAGWYLPIGLGAAVFIWLLPNHGDSIRVFLLNVAEWTVDAVNRFYPGVS